MFRVLPAQRETEKRQIREKGLTAKRQQLNEYLRGLTATSHSGGKNETKAGTESTTESGLTRTTTAPFDTTLSVDELASFNPNSGILWPGSIIAASSLETG